MKVLVIGLGSMGKRRIRLIKEIDDSIEIIGIDTNIDRSTNVKREFNISTYNDIKICFENEKLDAAFVCTSPLSHAEIINDLLRHDIYIFTELNLVLDGYDGFINEKKLFLSSTFLYRQDVRWIIDKVNGSRVNYIYHTGQYLPDWHPWEDYRNYFVGNDKSNGCREIMAIEFPWLIDAFGKIAEFHVYKDKISSLEVDYPDNYMLQLVHENGSIGLVAVDVISRSATRKMEIFSENLHITWDGRPDSLRNYNIENKSFESIKVYDDVQHRDGYSKNIIENAYKAEIESFFDYIFGKLDAALYSFREDYRVLSLINKIEEI